MGRYCAFKASGQYYVFNNDKTALIPITFNPKDPIYTKWMNPEDLNSLTEEQCSKLSGYFLELYSDIEDDVYTVTMENFDILQTTDTSHFVLSGFAGITSMSFNDTSTTCHVILSFDGRKTWYYYDFTTGEWKKTFPTKIYSSESNTVAQIPNLTEAIFEKIFTKHCTLDYAVSITNAEHVGSVTLNLPGNQAPKILSLTVEQNQTTHTKLIKVVAVVEDFEGDTINYDIKRIFKGLNDNQTIYKEGYNQIPPIKSGTCNPATNTYEYYIDPANIEIGYSELVFTYTDEKGLSDSKTVKIIKTNKKAYIAMVINRNHLSYTIEDEDSDFGKYRIIMNDTVITPGQQQTPLIQGDTTTGWTQITPIPVNNSFDIPLNLIRFGDPANEITIEFQEEFYDASMMSLSKKFMGYYYGILFIDPSQPYELTQDVTITNTFVNDLGNTVTETTTVKQPNPDYYYSTSLGDILKKLNLGSITHTRNSNTFEVGIVNLSEDIISQVVINGFTNAANNYKVCVSLTETFSDNLDNMSIRFNDVYPFDPNSADPKFGVHTFYVKLFSLDTTNWDIDDFITLEADSAGKYEPDTQTIGS